MNLPQSQVQTQLPIYFIQTWVPTHLETDSHMLVVLGPAAISSSVSTRLLGQHQHGQCIIHWSYSHIPQQRNLISKDWDRWDIQYYCGHLTMKQTSMLTNLKSLVIKWTRTLQMNLMNNYQCLYSWMSGQSSWADVSLRVCTCSIITLTNPIYNNYGPTGTGLLVVLLVWLYPWHCVSQWPGWYHLSNT